MEHSDDRRHINPLAGEFRCASPTELAEHLAKRKQLWEAREVSGQVDPKPQGGRPTQFASETEAKTGVPKRSVNRAIARAEAIPEDVRDQTVDCFFGHCTANDFLDVFVLDPACDCAP